MSSDSYTLIIISALASYSEGTCLANVYHCSPLCNPIQAEISGMKTNNMKQLDTKKNWAIKISARNLARMFLLLVRDIHTGVNVKQCKRPAMKCYRSFAHSCSAGLSQVAVLEEQSYSNGMQDLAFTWRDITPPSDGGRYQTCPVRSDKTDSDGRVGKFYVKKDQANTTQESGYCSTVLVPGSVPPPSQQTHTSAEQATVKKESRIESSKAEVDEDLEDKSECFPLQSNISERHSHAGPSVYPSEQDADASSATSRNGSSDANMMWFPGHNTSTSIAERDGETTHSEHLIDRYCSASAAEKNKSAKSSDDEADGHHPTSCLQGRDKGSALGFPTPASLEEGTPQDVHRVKSIGMAGFSEASEPPLALPPQNLFPSAQHSLPFSLPTSSRPRPMYQGNNNGLLQSISYTTSSFQNRAMTPKAAKGEPQQSADTTLASYVSKQDVASPKQGIVSSATLANCHHGVPDVHNRPGLIEGSGDIAVTTHAVSETSAGKRMDSLCVAVQHALLPASMKAGLTIRSPARYEMQGCWATHPYRCSAGSIPCTFMCVNVPAQYVPLCAM